ncbi:MAG: DUF2948 family protein [Sphingomonadaceae bacterium]
MAGLHLLAAEPADLPPISALLQDAILRAGDVAWEPRARRLALLVARYRWEERAQPSRVRALVTIRAVERVERHAWPEDAEAPLALLSVRAEGGERLLLDFAGGAALRLAVEVVDVALDDSGAPWPVRRRPSHRG